MPKQLQEIKNFTGGITSNASPTDISLESATYSLNINSNSIQGRLEGIKTDTVLTDHGFKRIVNAEADSIVLDYTNVYGNWGTDIASSYNTLLANDVSYYHKFSVGANETLQEEFDLRNMYFYTYFGLSTGEVGPVTGRGFVFDDLGTLTDIRLALSGSVASSDRQRLDTASFNNYRYHDAQLSTAQYVFGPNDGTGFKERVPLWPDDNIIQIAIKSKEFIFLLRDTDDGSSVPHPYSPFGTLESLNLPLLNGTHYGSSGWTPEITVIDVNLNANRDNATEGDAVDTLLNGIKTKLEEYPELCSVSITDKKLEVIPKSIGFNTARIMSIYNTSSTDGLGPQVIVNVPTTVLPFFGKYFTSVNNKKHLGQTDIVSFATSNNDQFIEYIQNVFGNTPQKTVLFNNINATDIDLVHDDEKVYFGFGANSNTPPKIGMSVSSSALSDLSVTDSFRIENFGLDEFNTKKASFSLGETLTFQMYGTEANGSNKEIMYDDLGSDELGYMDYDYEVADISGGYLHAYLAALNGGDGPKIGQVFYLGSSFADSSDAGFRVWMKYDYNFYETTPATGDLFMYCGLSENISTTSTEQRYPILRYLGTLGANGHTPAFAYSLQEGSLRINKISLTQETDANAFPGSNISGLKDTTDADVTILNSVSSRIQPVDLLPFLEGAFSEDVITAFSQCTGPFIENNLGLPGANSPFSHISTDAFSSHGGIKYIARHGVFWIALSSKPDSLYRLNLIDFDNVTDNGIRTEKISLSAHMIPSRLCNSTSDSELSGNNTGIINVTIPDQEWHNQESVNHDIGIGEALSHQDAEEWVTYHLDQGFESPLAHNWHNMPQDAEIIGICETFECGRIKALIDSPHIENYTAADAFEFVVSPCDMTIDDSENYSARLTTGDKVMFAGLSVSDNNEKKFNLNGSGPYEVNMVDTDRFIIQNANNGTPALDNNYLTNTDAGNKTFWYNSKVWIIYGLKDSNSSFNKWDLFLYNANTLDMPGKNLTLADRTPPYNEMGYYLDETVNDTKIYYPRQFAHLMNHFYPNCSRDIFLSSSFDEDGINFWEGDSFNNNGDIEDELVEEQSDTYGIKWNRKNFYPNGFQISKHTSDYLPQSPLTNTFGIYDKSGRWSLNGGKVMVHRNYNLYRGSMASFPYGQCVPMRSGNDSMEDAYGANINDAGITHSYLYGMSPAANGLLHWGDNLGWICDNPRQTKPVKNSLHPLVHYSRCYLAGRLYQGSNATDETLNLPKHAVSFLGNLEGHFLNRHTPYERHNGLPINMEGSGGYQWAYGYFGQGADLSALIDQYSGETAGDLIDELNGDYGVQFNGDNIQPLKPFTVNSDDSQGSSPEGASAYSENSQNYNYTYGDVDADDVSEYEGDLCLFQIDEWTGHPGIVYRNAQQGSTPSQTDFGVVRGRPNFGGPEIENPNYKPWVELGVNANAEDEHYAYNDDTQIEGMMHSSVNLGYVDDDSNHDQGWTGYRPPHLFQPGSGYYVFINRTWKTESPRTIHNSESHITNSENVWDNKGWNFQWFTWPSDKPNSRAGIDENSNRWHNFSATAVADSYDSGFDEDNNINRNAYYNRYITSPRYTSGDSYQEMPWIHNKFTARKLIPDNVDNSDSGNAITFQINTSDALPQNMIDNVFKTGRGGNQGPVCTFHKIDIAGLGNINNIYPTVLKTKQAAANTTWRDNMYVPAYICGTRTTDNESDSGIAVICNNMHHRIQKNASDNIDEIYWMNNNWNGIGQYIASRNISGDVADTDAHTNYHNRNTRKLETFEITNERSSRWGNTYLQNLLGDHWLGGRVREASFQQYQSGFIGNDLVVFSDTNIPLAENNTPSDGSISENTLDARNMWFSFSGDEDNKTYLGFKSDVFDFDGDNQNTYVNQQPIFFNGEPLQTAEYDAGGVFTSTLISGSNDGSLRYNTIGAVEITPTGEVIDASDNDDLTQAEYGIENNTYKYKISLEYDSQYDSELHVIPFQVDTGTYDSNNTGGLWDYNNIEINILKSYINSISMRVTGINLWRAIGKLSTDYALVKSIPFKSEHWTYKESKAAYTHTLQDDGASLGTYETINGIHPSLHHTSLHYGLSTTYKGYMYVTRAWHPELEDIERYIFRSLPGNFFVYNWMDEYCILPEKPLAMTSFNSRLYVWGKNKLYKIDPINLIIEDEFEGISIASRNAFVKTEFGLCFLDNNNVYIHDGNRPNPIGGPILNAGTYPTKQSLTDSDRLQSGYKELLKQTLENGDAPNVFYLSTESSFAILLSNKNKEGRLFTYNILNKRWDFVESPRPIGVSSTSNGAIFISDGELLWNFVASPDKDYYTYARREFTWHSKDINLGTDTQDKVFKGINLSGTPSYYYTDSSSNNLEFDEVNIKTSSVKAYVDGAQVPLKLQNRMYNSTMLGNTSLADNIGITGQLLCIPETTLYFTFTLPDITQLYGLNTPAGLLNLGSINTGETAINIDGQWGGTLRNLIPGHEYQGWFNPTDGNLISTDVFGLQTESDDSTSSIIKIQTDDSVNKRQEFIRPGHYIKINNEIMWVSAVNVTNAVIELTVSRGRLGTTTTSHAISTPISIISPRLKIDSGSKGKRLKIVLEGQRGFIDTIGLIYKTKGIK